MKNYAALVISGGLLAFAVGAGACGGDGGTGATGGTGTTSSSSSSSGTTSSSSSSSSGTTSSSSSSSSGTTSSSSSSSSGGPVCEGYVDNTSPCGGCLETSCCPDLAACGEDGTCLDCATGNATDPTVCEDTAVKALIDALRACMTSNCNDECIPKSACNPITNESCDTAGGYACDLDANSGVYQCFEPPNNAACGAACSNSAGPFCQAGMHCNQDMTSGQCTPFCCDDNDCGANGTCDTASLNNVSNIGICVPKTAGALSVCDGPKPVTSMGSCFTP